MALIRILCLCEDSQRILIVIALSFLSRCSPFFFFLCSPNATGSVETLDDQTETESVVSFRRERPRHRESMEQHGEERKIAVLMLEIWLAARRQTT